MSSSDIRRIDELKSTGNALFQQQKWADAIDAYEEAIDIAMKDIQQAMMAADDMEKAFATIPKAPLVPQQTVAALFSNVSAAWLAQGEAERAVINAEVAIKMAPKWGKAHCRRALAFIALKNWRDSLNSIKTALALEPTNAEFKTIEADIRRAQQLTSGGAKVGSGENVSSASTTGGDGGPVAVLVKDHLQMSVVPMPPLQSLAVFHPPILASLGVPIGIAYAPNSTRKGDNQLATFFMIEQHSGFAPIQWQTGCVGDVIVFRTDGASISTQEVHALWDYFSGILDEFGEGTPPVIDSEHMRKWQVSYNDLAIQCGSTDATLREVHFI